MYLEREKKIGSLAMRVALDELYYPGQESYYTIPVGFTKATAFTPLSSIDDNSSEYYFKPDPLTAASLPELEGLVRELWVWAGRPSGRRLAADSGGSFSHATISKLIYDQPGKPKLRLEYLIGFVRACGLGEEEEKRWATAWRRLSAGQGVVS